MSKYSPESLIRHTSIYLIGRVVPGIVSLVSLAIYTRLLTTEEYGLYALVLATVGMLNGLLFQWLSLGTGRLIPETGGNSKNLLSTALLSYAVISLFLIIAGGVASWLWSNSNVRWFILLGAVIVSSQAWFDLNIQIINSTLKAVSYSAIVAIKAIIGLMLSVYLVEIGMGVIGILIGTTIALLISPISLINNWRAISISKANKSQLFGLVNYGLPLIVTYLLRFVIDSSDRYLLEYFKGTSSVGLYAPAYDLAQQTLGLLLSTVHLAGFPITLNALVAYGIQGAQSSLRRHAIVLLGLSVPAALGLSMLAPNMAFVFLGSEFQQDANILIAVISISVLISGIRGYYFDYSFQLAKRMRKQVIVFLVGAITNIILNVILIPKFGTAGAAYATLFAFAATLFASYYLGRQAFPMPNIPLETVKILPACLFMAAGLYIVRDWRGPLALLCQVLVGASIYFLILILSNYSGMRNGFLLFYLKKETDKLRRKYFIL